MLMEGNEIKIFNLLLFINYLTRGINISQSPEIESRDSD